MLRLWLSAQSYALGNVRVSWQQDGSLQRSTLPAELPASQIALANGTVLKSKAAVVTLPLGVLQRRLNVFDPPLPIEQQLAIDRMGMGVLDKVILIFPKASTSCYVVLNPGER